ncbi:hypothetical protein GBF38_003316 [Nibea albiflora]|uniref:Uncharacterized protein n=1 Tax=Nibea albiflora TaxID=240163 RepID=A0ACB7FJL7_NIBAL|nr:hypothetical protein GBF38_003316 [Nibea albiflora]
MDSTETPPHTPFSLWSEPLSSRTGVSVVSNLMQLQQLSSVPVVSAADCCCLLFSPQHNKTAVQVKEDMKKMVQIPMLRPKTAKHTKLFGVSLFELQERGPGGEWCASGVEEDGGASP